MVQKQKGIKRVSPDCLKDKGDGWPAGRPVGWLAGQLAGPSHIWILPSSLGNILWNLLIICGIFTKMDGISVIMGDIFFITRGIVSIKITLW